jgi:7,8-dihydropterin-6-yl-methyl-4-(beta-D-ribofuranosyl)aminobenzene 5'-phosphate synthase
MIGTCDRLTVRILDENYIDMLLADGPGVRRFGMARHFDPKDGVPWAENGLSYLVDVESGGQVRRILFDAGFSADVVLHNMELLGIPPASIDHVVLSHGHPDHCGGIVGVLEAIGRPLPVAVHPHAFYPRYIRPSSGQPMTFINLGFGAEEIQRAGGRLVLTRTPLEIGAGLTTSGEVERSVEFEQEVPAGRYHVLDGGLAADEIIDDQALFAHVRGLGLVVLSGCAHSGIVNTIRHGLALTGANRLHAVMGGFHLGHPGISEDKIERTAEALGELAPKLVSPMHCSGFRTWRVVAEKLPEAFTLMTVAATVEFSAGDEPV